MVLAYLALKQERLDDAERALAAAHRLDPDDPTSVLRLGQVSWSRRDYDGALRYLNEARRLDPYDAGLHANLGLLYVFKRDRVRALEALREAERLDPEGHDVNALQMACQAYRVLGDLPKAIEGYDRFLVQARKEGLYAEGIERFEQTVDRLRRSMTPTFVEASMPKVYTDQRLQQALRGALTEEQVVCSGFIL